MAAVKFSYIDHALDDLEDGAPPVFWRHFHWGLFDDSGTDDDSAERYFAAAEAMTDRMVSLAGIDDGRSVLDVGCGFGGTLDHIRSGHPACRLFGINIDVRQLRWARQVVAVGTGAGGGAPISFLTADGCVLPVATAGLDHVMAVECVFHFPSRKAFFHEAARALRPGGTLTVSDFLMARGTLAQVANTMAGFGLGDSNWYGRMAKPLTAEGYGRLARRAGLVPMVDEDVTARTLPTYPALRRLAREAGTDEGVTTVNGVEELSVSGALEYHLMGFRKPEPGEVSRAR